MLHKPTIALIEATNCSFSIISYDPKSRHELWFQGQLRVQAVDCSRKCQMKSAAHAYSNQLPSMYGTCWFLKCGHMALKSQPWGFYYVPAPYL